jgi:hypothetical protein
MKNPIVHVARTWSPNRFRLYRSLGPGNGKPPLQNLPYHTHINPTRDLRQGLQWSNSKGRIIEFGAIAGLLVGHGKQGTPKVVCAA